MSDNKTPYPYMNNEETDEIDLGFLFGMILDDKWLISSIVSIFTVLGLIYVLFATPIYQADALVQVEQNPATTLLSDISAVLPTTPPPSETEIELIQSRMILGKTIEDLGLDNFVEQKYFPVFGKGFARLMKDEPAKILINNFTVIPDLLDESLVLKITGKENYEITHKGTVILKGSMGVLSQANGVEILVSNSNAPIGTSFNVIKRPELSVYNELLADLNIADKGKDTGIIGLSLTGADPIKIKDTLNSIVDNYLFQNIERKSEEAAKSLSFLKEQLPQVRKTLNDSEDKLNMYRQRKDSVDLSLEAKSVLDSLLAVETQLNQLTLKEAEISKLYTKEHPAYRSLIEQRQSLEQEKDDINKRINTMPKTQQEILRLTRDVESGQAVYMQLLNKQQELNISKASTVGNVRIIDKAIYLPTAVQPKKALVISIAILLGLFISISIVLIKNALHKGITNQEELEKLGYNVYANIPLSEWEIKNNQSHSGRKHSSKSDVQENKYNLLALIRPIDLSIESLRSLRTSLHFAMLQAANNLVMITSPNPELGKSFVCSNLAVVLAQTGKKVLLIDADMRRGYLHVRLSGNNKIGLSDVLATKNILSDAIQKTSVENLDFISRGRVPPNPSELLMHENLNILFNEIVSNYDIILVDTPPILAVTDAAIIGKYIGTSLMVARFEETTAKDIEVSVRKFEQTGVKIKGIIINAIVRRASSYYKYGDSYYTYEYKNNN